MMDKVQNKDVVTFLNCPVAFAEMGSEIAHSIWSKIVGVSSLPEDEQRSI